MSWQCEEEAEAIQAYLSKYLERLGGRVEEEPP